AGREKKDHPRGSRKECLFFERMFGQNSWWKRGVYEKKLSQKGKIYWRRMRVSRKSHAWSSGISERTLSIPSAYNGIPFLLIKSRFRRIFPELLSFLLTLVPSP